jgi:hypothetical protein
MLQPSQVSVSAVTRKGVETRVFGLGWRFMVRSSAQQHPQQQQIFTIS